MQLDPTRPAHDVEGSSARAALDLLDWRRTVFELYADIRASDDPPSAWKRWREVRDELFANHPQSPLPPENRGEFGGVPYYEYAPQLRVFADVEEAEPERFGIDGSAGSVFGATRVGVARFDLLGERSSLDLFWLDGYGGGLYVPFRDATSGRTTYGACRYLLDTVKGSDLGTADGRLVFDFNFAYNPSCSYDPRWACPLAPPGNRLSVAVEAGERYEPRGA